MPLQGQKFTFYPHNHLSLLWLPLVPHQPRIHSRAIFNFKELKMPVGRGKSCWCVTFCHWYPFYSFGCALKITPRAGLRGQGAGGSSLALTTALGASGQLCLTYQQGVTQSCGMSPAGTHHCFRRPDHTISNSGCSPKNQQEPRIKPGRTGAAWHLGSGVSLSI